MASKNQRWGLESLDSDSSRTRVPILLDSDSSPTPLDSDSDSTRDMRTWIWLGLGLRDSDRTQQTHSWAEDSIYKFTEPETLKILKRNGNRPTVDSIPLRYVLTKY